MLITKPVAALTAGALLISATALPAAAQYAPPSCTELYANTMAVYQRYGAQSPQYAEMFGSYSARCLAGSSIGPAYPYWAPEAGEVYAIDPGAALLGGAIGGAIIGGVIAGHGGHHRGFHAGRVHGGFHGGRGSGHHHR